MSYRMSAKKAYCTPIIVGFSGRPANGCSNDGWIRLTRAMMDLHDDGLKRSWSYWLRWTWAGRRLYDSLSPNYWKQRLAVSLFLVVARYPDGGSFGGRWPEDCEWPHFKDRPGDQPWDYEREDWSAATSQYRLYGDRWNRKP